MTGASKTRITRSVTLTFARALEQMSEREEVAHGERVTVDGYGAVLGRSDSVCRAWRIGELGEPELRAEFAQIKPVYFDRSLRSLWVLNGVKRSRKRIITLRFTFRVTPGVTRSYWEHKRCAWRGNGFGHGQNTRMGWSDPQFGNQRLAKMSRGRSSPQRSFSGAMPAVRTSSRRQLSDFVNQYGESPE